MWWSSHFAQKLFSILSADLPWVLKRLWMFCMSFLFSVFFRKIYFQCCCFLFWSTDPLFLGTCCSLAVFVGWQLCYPQKTCFRTLDVMNVFSITGNLTAREKNHSRSKENLVGDAWILSLTYQNYNSDGKSVKDCRHLNDSADTSF